MQKPETAPGPDEPAPHDKRHPYTPPEIVWREPYEPMSYGISCAKQPGNPVCNAGPASA